MIIDCHGHVSAPAELWAYKASILSHRGAHGRGKVIVTDDEIRAAANKKEMAPVGHLDMLKRAGTDMQLLSPRPFQMMHSAKPARLVHWFTAETNDIVFRQTQLFPGLFIGVAGLPQAAGEPIENTLPELERCVKQLGFKGCLLNPDPYENSGTEAPPLGDRYWYPLYEKLCELDVPDTFTPPGLTPSARPTRCISSTRRPSRSMDWSIRPYSRISRHSRLWSRTVAVRYPTKSAGSRPRQCATPRVSAFWTACADCITTPCFTLKAHSSC